MGSWNALCLTIPAENPPDLAARLETLLEADWRTLTEDIALPDDAVDLTETHRSLTLDDFSVETRGEYAYCHAGGHGPTFDELQTGAYSLLAHLDAETAVITKRFEDGQGSATVYQREDTASEWMLEHSDPVGDTGYVESDSWENWDSAYGAEHAANALGTEYRMDVGIGENTLMYVLDVRRHRL